MSQAEYCMGGLPLHCEASMRWVLALCNEAMCRASRRYCGTGEAFDNIYVERDIATWEDLDERLRRMEHFIQNPPGPPLRLVIIDSIAHLFSDSVDFQSGEARIGGIRVACIRASISMCMGTLQIFHSSCCGKQLSLLAGGYAERTAQLFRVAGLLKQYADKYKFAIVVTNQVTLILITASLPRHISQLCDDGL